MPRLRVGQFGLVARASRLRVEAASRRQFLRHAPGRCLNPQPGRPRYIEVATAATPCFLIPKFGNRKSAIPSRPRHFEDAVVVFRGVGRTEVRGGRRAIVMIHASSQPAQISRALKARNAIGGLHRQRHGVVEGENGVVFGVEPGVNRPVILACDDALERIVMSARLASPGSLPKPLQITRWIL